MPAAPSELRAHQPRLSRRLGRKLRRLASSGDVVLSSGLRYSLLALYVATIYVVVLAVGGIDATSAGVPWWLNLAALLLVVPTLFPVHGLLRQSINQLVYGQHDDPYAVLTHVNRSLDGRASPDALLPSLAETLATTLKLPYVALEARGATEGRSATYGAPPRSADIVSLPLAYHRAVLGTLRVSSRRPRERLSADDLRLLGDLARQVGMTLHAAQLSEALQASREQIVLAREEERRRIRRDLHDGLGPSLASIRLQLSALRNVVADNPDAERRIDELRVDVRAATAEIRRLVYDLRPPMLDEFGLSGALRNLAQRTDGLTYTMDAPTALPPLPAAIEVAMYRIAAEALNNIARHARATRCSIRLALDDATLALTVTDDGRGLPADYLAGVGHQSMAERAAELGGSVSIGPAPAGGTQVTASFTLKEAPRG